MGEQSSKLKDLEGSGVRLLARIPLQCENPDGLRSPSITLPTHTLLFESDSKTLANDPERRGQDTRGLAPLKRH